MWAPQLGVTAPISTKAPTEDDRVASESMAAFLGEIGALENDACLELRRAVLGSLTELAEAWAGSLTVQRGLPALASAQDAVRLMPFGSCQLGAAGPSADIDIVCVVTRHISRSDFVSGLVMQLEQHADVECFNSVQDARVPVVKFLFRKVQIDMLFANLSLSRLGDLDLSDDTILHSMDEQSVRSLNGCRVASELLQLVPQIDNFRMALRFVKEWASRRSIYSNVLGYFAGVSLAILMARVCQLYPCALPSVLVSRFFRLYEQWSWPRPVVLKHTAADDFRVSVKSWNAATSKKDRQHIFPVITPATPTMNSMAYCSASTMKVMLDEVKHAAKLSLSIENDSQHANWALLFQYPPFFQLYSHYLTVELAAATSVDLYHWYTLVESRLRVFAGSIDRNPTVQDVHVNPIAHPLPGSLEFPHCVCFVLALRLDKKQLPLDLTKCRDDFLQSVKSWDKYSERGMWIHIRYCKRRDLPTTEASKLEPRLAQPKVQSKKRKRDVLQHHATVAIADEPQ